ncbi:MAG: hypothetical protein ACI9DC_004442 [Gammaproteobacteria bacterium]
MIEMPSWLKWNLVLCVVAGALGGYLYVFEPQLARQLVAATPLARLAPPAASVTTAYKWRDAKGNWQLTGQPPPEGTAYEVLETRSGDNIVPALPISKK